MTRLERAQSCEEKLGYSFKNKSLLEQALTHKSYHNEHTKNSVGHNERFEFLGDAVLDLALSHQLMNRFPEFTEGELSKARASLVNEAALHGLARQLQIEECILFGKGEIQSGGATKPRLIASTLEALIGAAYLDSNYVTVSELLFKIFTPGIESLDTDAQFTDDYKTRLQEKLQSESKQPPQYILEKEEGPDHDKIFHVVVKIEDQVIAHGTGRSKKQAEQSAAKSAWGAL